MRDKTLKLIEAAYQALQEYHPMTLRQCYYQLVSKHFLDNNLNQYKRLSNALVKARQQGLIPWDWIEDRIRQPRVVSMWRDLSDFLETVQRAYRKDIWDRQPRYVIVWVEKDALSGIFEEITAEYGVPLIVGRGYNSWSIKKDIADMVKAQSKPATVLYFGDFDPSGEDIHRDLRDSFLFFGTSPKTTKVALTKQDVINYRLPHDFAKKTDTRAKKFIERYGDMAVELDALPLPVLQEKIRESIEANLDLPALNAVLLQQEADQERLRKLLAE
jgi:DNA topoisomerase VI subunit A